MVPAAFANFFLASTGAGCPGWFTLNGPERPALFKLGMNGPSFYGAWAVVGHRLDHPRLDRHQEHV